MAETTIDIFRQKLRESTAEIDRLTERRRKIDETLQRHRQERDLVVQALKLVGAEVPELDQLSPGETGQPTRNAMRAIDAVWTVTAPGESVSAGQVAERIRERGIAFHSENLRNAVATAMSRCSEFRRVGRGQFSRSQAATPDG